MRTFVSEFAAGMNLYLYKVVISVCLFVCPIKIHEPLGIDSHRILDLKTLKNVLVLVLKF